MSRHGTAAALRGGEVETRPGATTLAVDPASSVIRYGIVHPLHRVTGQSSAIQGRAIVEADGRVVAGALVPVASFRSGDADRDARAVEILGAFVVFRGEARLPPGAARADVTMRGELTLHAVKRPISVSLAVEVGGGTARVRGAFEVSLEAHGIARPSLLLMPVEDTCRVELELTLRDVARRG